ncbi:helix-turn-helix transcriptional regulator [Acidimangrovimonas sediminis]|uniref:helix-turn-helix transcriptional regulator n=1 Tax=Acidimangrovimonas sediminis TaxID=2056283 RepID=UPI000C80D9A4|nr:YafY family protein [Acidimangrovimonas sediminis]
MRRADRLFQIIQILRRSPRPVTAAEIGAELEVSRRTVYRDIADLIGQRVPIQGEAGLGYVLAEDYEMPPLALSLEEAEAISLGAQWVATHPDRALARAAQDALAKIRFSLPEVARLMLDLPAVGTKAPDVTACTPLDTAVLRRAIRQERVLTFSYLSLDGTPSARSVWPVVLGYEQGRCLLIAWCETRRDFRHFRAERMRNPVMLDRRPERRRALLVRDWQAARARTFAGGIPR